MRAALNHASLAPDAKGAVDPDPAAKSSEEFVERRNLVHPRLERRGDVGHVELPFGDVDDDRDDVAVVYLDLKAVGLVEH
jgi:hypothetical protein